MCFSAMIRQDLKKLSRYCPQVDFGQIEMTFARRLENPKFYKIPRAFEANFESPTTPEQVRIKTLIDEHRSRVASELEAELFKQKTRLVEAERHIREKQAANKAPTKKALKDQEVATDKVESLRVKLSDLTRTETKPRDARIFPHHFAPIIVHENGSNRIVLARYLLRRRGAPATFDAQFNSSLYNSRRDNLEKFWKTEFGKAHALALVDSFFENVEGKNGANQVLHFTPDTDRPMHIACLFSQWGDLSQDGFYSFSAITDEPPDEVRAAGHDRCIVNLEEDAIAEWLSPEGKSFLELQAILDRKERPFYEHEVLAA